ncbi:MAG TPA: tRNA 2-thiocytidine biosynthesis TtcA family protein, partial [Methanomassiliicoccales archaeon]|nr:tRNA 2-thiocytidine biosynthesis TtcA family protein [Methanomassiliicoccales archaeon]
MASCSKCSKSASTFIRYNGTHLCREHFNEYVEKRVKREVRQQLILDGKRRLGVCISGGKDSAVTLELMVKILGQRRDVEICAITVDEGIDGYRPNTLTQAQEQCRRLGVTHHIVTFKEVVGMDLDDMAPFDNERTACSYCGVFRRRCLNQKAKELSVDLLVTGHNLDDTAQSVLMNFTRGDVERLARLGPHLKVQPGLVPRMEPLRTIPEKESMLYAILNGIEHSDEECPYAGEALRNEYRRIIDSLEDGHPGTKHSIVSS